MLVAKAPANTEKPKLFGGLLPKTTLSTFPAPQPTPKKTPAPTHPTLKELLVSKAPAVTPVRTVLVPVTTTVPAVAVSGTLHTAPNQYSVGPVSAGLHQSMQLEAPVACQEQDWFFFPGLFVYWHVCFIVSYFLSFMCSFVCQHCRSEVVDTAMLMWVRKGWAGHIWSLSCQQAGHSYLTYTHSVSHLMCVCRCS